LAFLAAMNTRTPWQRMALSLFGIVIVWLTWYHSIHKLNDCDVAKISSFTTITVNTQYAIVAIVVFMVTGKLITDWKANTAATIVDVGKDMIPTKEKKKPTTEDKDT
jgi:hypothetical protein